MLSFRTNLEPQPAGISITHQDVLLPMGSCFAEHIGERLSQYKFNTLLNPFGILYNPVSIAQGLQTLVSGRRFLESDLVFFNDQWHSFAHHGRFSGLDPEETLHRIQVALDRGKEQLNQTTRLILTLGTAHVFVWKATGRVVANCHKMPGQYFERRRLSLEEVIEALQPVLQQLKDGLPALEVILTVSPVRHIRDGLLENQRSKATLILAVDALCRNLDFVHYFPAYELLLDDLRDYRFYDTDMIHPSPLAVDYIWEFFQKCFFPLPTLDLIAKITKVVMASRHRPFFPKSAQHQAFLKQQMERIEALEKAFPFLSFVAERKIFEAEEQKS